MEPPFPDYDDLDEDLLRIFTSHNQQDARRDPASLFRGPPAENLPPLGAPAGPPAVRQGYLEHMANPSVFAAPMALPSGSQSNRALASGKARSRRSFLWSEADPSIRRGIYAGATSQDPNAEESLPHLDMSGHSRSMVNINFQVTFEKGHHYKSVRLKCFQKLSKGKFGGEPYAGLKSVQTRYGKCLPNVY